MKREIRLVALMLLLVLSVSLLSGCHGSYERNSFEIPKSFDSTSPIEITFWAKNDTNRAQTLIYKQAIEDFCALYPNVTINLRLYTDYGRIYNDVITNTATNTTPNVCITYPDHIATYLTGSGSVVALDELMQDARYGLGGSELRFDAPTIEEIIPEYLNECNLAGQTYAMPYMRSTEACYVNKTMVEQLGYTLPEVITWDFVWEVSEAAARRDENGIYFANGQKVMIPFIYKSTDNMMIQMLRQKGAAYANESGEIMLFNDDTRSLLHDIAEHTSNGAFSTFKISSYPANFLNAGQCVFAIDSTAGSTWMGSQAPLSDIAEDQFVQFETAVMSVPQFDIDQPKMISQGPSVCIFNKENPQEVLASWLFVQYLLSNKVQIGYAQTEGYVPVTTKARNDPAYTAYLAKEGADDELHYDVKLRASKLLLNNTQNTFVTPVFNGSASLRDASGQLIEDVVKGVRRKKTIDDAFIDTLFQDVSALYRLFQSSGMGVNTSGALPTASVCLLTSLALIWLVMGTYIICNAIKKKKSNKQH